MDIQPVFPEDVSEYGWLGLRKYTNEKLLFRLLCEKHAIPKKQHGNARKQALQIRQCLIQAEEYHRSADAVSDAIRPLLLYYGTLSLALAEILLKGDGMSSLDQARGKHAHHGLELSIVSNPSQFEKPEEAASKLRAKPHLLKGGGRFGTFELWHRNAFEQPLCGATTRIIKQHAHQSNFQRIADQSVDPLAKVPKAGLDLLWCFRNTPAMRQALATYGISSLHVRASLSRTQNLVEKYQEDEIVTHPNMTEIVQRCMEQIIVPTRDYENYDIDDIPNGYRIKIRATPQNPLTGGSFPNAFQSETSRVFFLSDNPWLNEFGVYYFGLYILGNYCRYYPDFWMNEFENASSLYFLSSRFMTIAQNRLPILLNSQFSGKWPIIVSSAEY